MKKLKFNSLDLSRGICNHFLGEQHSLSHRMIVGFAIMTVGVNISHICADCSYLIVKLAGDIAGYAIHGIGLIPCADYLTILIKKS